MYQAAASAAAMMERMERPQFAIDDAKDDDEDTDDETEFEDDGVMDEVGHYYLYGYLIPNPWYSIQVDAFLEAHESGLTEAERELAKGWCNLCFLVASFAEAIFRSHQCGASKVNRDWRERFDEGTCPLVSANLYHYHM